MNFIECTSLNVNYNIMGIVTVTYTIVQDTYDTDNVVSSITAGGQTFSGYVTDISVTPIVRTNWHEVHVTLIATTD